VHLIHLESQKDYITADARYSSCIPESCQRGKLSSVPWHPKPNFRGVVLTSLYSAGHTELEQNEPWHFFVFSTDVDIGFCL